MTIRTHLNSKTTPNLIWVKMKKKIWKFRFSWKPILTMESKKKSKLIMRRNWTLCRKFTLTISTNLTRLSMVIMSEMKMRGWLKRSQSKNPKKLARAKALHQSRRIKKLLIIQNNKLWRLMRCKALLQISSRNHQETYSIACPTTTSCKSKTRRIWIWSCRI